MTGEEAVSLIDTGNKEEISIIRCKSEITEQKVNFYKYIQIFFNTWLDDKNK